MSNSTNEISLSDLISQMKYWVSFFKKKWSILVLAVLIGGGAGVGYSVFQKPLYVANLSFVLQDEKSGSGGIGGALGLASQFGVDLGVSGGGAFSEANLMELMKSRNLVEKTLLSEISDNGDNISLVEYYLKFKGIREKWAKNQKLNKITFLPNADRKKFSRTQDSILGKIYFDISGQVKIIQRDKKIGILNIEVKTGDEKFSKIFAETLSSVVSAYYVETKSKKALLNVQILERQVDSIRGELNSAINNVAIANDNAYNLNPALNVKRVPSTKRQVDVQANTAILTQLVANLELARVTLRKETPLIQVIDMPIYPLEVEKIGKRKAAMAGAFLVLFSVIVFFILRELLQKL